VQAQSVGGGGGNGGFSGAITLAQGGTGQDKATTNISVTVGGFGGSAGVGGDVHVGSDDEAFRADVTTHGNDAVGIQAQSIGGGGGNGGVSLSGPLHLTGKQANKPKPPNNNGPNAGGGGGGKENGTGGGRVEH